MAESAKGGCDGRGAAALLGRLESVVNLSQTSGRAKVRNTGHESLMINMNGSGIGAE